MAKQKEAWDKLSMLEKALLIKLSVDNGVSSLKLIRDTYNLYSSGGNLGHRKDATEVGESLKLNWYKFLDNYTPGKYTDLIHRLPESLQKPISKARDYTGRVLKAVGQVVPYTGWAHDLMDSGIIVNTGNSYLGIGKLADVPFFKVAGKVLSLPDLVDDSVELYNAVLNRPSEKKIAPYIEDKIIGTIESNLKSTRGNLSHKKSGEELEENLDLNYIQQRDDFKGNFITKLVPTLWGRHGDLSRYYFGQPTKDNALVYSLFKPSKSNNPSTKYIAIALPEFKDYIVDAYFNHPEYFVDDKHYNGNFYSSFVNKNHKLNNYDLNNLGTFTLGKGRDERGDYLSYYDIWDTDTSKQSNPDFQKEYWGAAKPFEVYDRIYLDDYYKVPNTEKGTIFLPEIIVTPNTNKKSTGGPLYPFSFEKNPFLKTPVVRYDEGGPLNNWEQGALDRATKVYSNYELAKDNKIPSWRIPLQKKLKQLDLPSGLSNCTLTATQWVDPTNPIMSAATIFNNPKTGYVEIDNKDAIPGNLLITKNPETGGYHTMMIEGFTDSGEPILRYSNGNHTADALRTNISLSEYHSRDNSHGGNHTEDHYFRYNYPNEVFLPEITVFAKRGLK